MNKMKETIREYEYLTAGRYYSVDQKRAIFRLVARANALSEGEEAELSALIFSEDMAEFKTETDCANGILMASFLKNSNYRKEILSARKKTIETLNEKRLFDSKVSWLKFIHSDKNRFENLLDKAIYLYGRKKVDKAAETLKEIAESFHLLSVKLIASMYAELNLANEEARYLVILKRIIEELLYDEVPEEYGERLSKLRESVPEEFIKEVYGLKLTYFGEDWEYGAHIGFN